MLSPVIGLFCHRHRRSCLHQLDAGVEASGPHDFAVRNMALSSAAPAASTASRTNVRDDREAPLLRDGIGSMYNGFDFGKTEIFFDQGWTGRKHTPSLICPSGKSVVD